MEFRRLFRLDRGALDVRREVDDELRFHFEMTVEDLISAGIPAAAARAEAGRRFGDVDRTAERLRAIDAARAATERRAEWWSDLAQDIRYALRGIRRQPGFAIAIIVTLGLGIGANVTMFGIVDQLLLRAPAYLENAGDVNRLYFAQMRQGKEVIDEETKYLRYREIERTTASFSSIVASFAPRMPIGGANAVELRVTWASAST